MNQRLFTLGLAGTFFLPWFLLIIIPHSRMDSLEPIPYALENDDEAKNDVGAEGTHYPPGRSGLVTQGAMVYASEGCAYCHTQMIRPTYLGFDRWRDGWAGRGLTWEGSEVGSEVRETRPRDYAGEKFAFLGINRFGSDLSNVGWRMTSADDYHRVLFNPRLSMEWSKMPSYRHLYTVKEIDGASGGSGIVVADGDKTVSIVPGKQAKALVSYLMSLKKDYKIPGSGNDDKKRELLAGGSGS